MKEQTQRTVKQNKAWKKKTDSEFTPYTAAKDPADFLARELDSCGRAYKGGNEGAILEAIILCAEAGKLPEWLSFALIDFVGDRLKRPRGRNGRSWLKQHKQDMIDFTRYDTIQDVRDHSIHWEHAYAVAADLLSGGGAQGSAETMKQSYSRVKNRSKKTPGRYKLFFKALRSALPQEPPPHPASLWQTINSLRTDRD